MKVPNYIPTKTGECKLAVIGEAPGSTEVVTRIPFTGGSGTLLRELLCKAGVNTSEIFFGNVCQYHPPGDDFQQFGWDSAFVQEGLKQLQQDLEVFNPNCCLLLGNIPLKAATDPTTLDYAFKKTVSTWRGTIFRVDSISSPLCGRKAVASYHPAAVLRNYPWKYPLYWDITKAVRESRSPDLTLPTRQIDIVRSLSELRSRVDEVLQTKQPISVDIEGGPNEGISCVGIATSPSKAFVVEVENGNENWTIQVLSELKRIFLNPDVPKILQNSLYDNFCLSWCFKMPIVGVSDDTMLKHWELYCELEKSLAFQTSVYTSEPYYKLERKSEDKTTFLTYCGKDAAVTYEINDVLTKALYPQAGRWDHYQFNLSVLRPLLYMELRGIRYNRLEAEARTSEIEALCAKLQTEINQEVSKLTDGAITSINLRSAPQMRNFLYGALRLPAPKNKGADTDTLYALAVKYRLPVLLSIIKFRSLKTRQNLLSTPVGPDGRMHCSYNVVGSETGRVTCSKSPLGCGCNLQTVPDEDRDLFLADEGMEMFQVDLSGADGWTVAARSASLGFPNLLEDLQKGVKIAKKLAYAFTHGPEKLKSLGEEELKEELKKIDKTDPLYFCAKQTQHGSNYGMRPEKICELVLTASEGKVLFSEADARKLQNAYFTMYPGVLYWHRMAAQWLLSGRLVCASGHERVFLDRLKDNGTLRQYLAHEPQANTTYVTNRALLWLWTSPKNRRCGRLVVEPLHHVHDALVGQWPVADRELGMALVKEAFSQSLTVAGITITIPFEGRYGKSWGNLDKEFV